ncbi:MAG: hypothetical protein KME55_04365 [Nostoc indistinguendum CM1-VF10]|jgi:hypothetical protein|nr:hypothetical protein [Nostoc indistinguendum CM1-VF10]
MTDNHQQLTVNDRKECLYNLGAHQLNIKLDHAPTIKSFLFLAFPKLKDG